ncbi:putative membrane protein [Planctomicrobium piriforme]|uniref:Putative membrane protein n=1 Tax=Planctomicrobium piriforme TaxID=1576369 RepID=A0A1I3BE92_9PLAN|nr:bestrophin [Planctomicrobium piriforme]SFH60011.1 putative membrane protein [Planctomicrobium piriforme]
MLVGAYAAIPAIKEATQYAAYGDQPADIHAAFTFVLGLLLVFRTNAAYARWWEARSLWGALVNASRNLAVKISALAQIDQLDLMRSRGLIVSFPRLLRDHLRNTARNTRYEMLAADSSELPHIPSEVVEQLYILLAKWKAAGQIDGDELRVIDADALRLLDICGGCEKIRNTRIVRSYRIFARQCVVLSLLTFPWGVANEFHWWTIPMSTIMAYFMLGLETVAEHVEEPFGYDEDDLDLDGLCDTIARSVHQVYERRDVLKTMLASPATN